MVSIPLVRIIVWAKLSNISQAFINGKSYPMDLILVPQESGFLHYLSQVLLCTNV